MGDELLQPPTQHILPQPSQQGDLVDMDVRSDTPTEVAAFPTEVVDSSSTPVGPPAPTDPAAALQQQLER
eukprot:9326936-Prorocentrum_lima.AAC.1